MRKWLGMAVAGLVALACVATAQAKNYALCTGLNEYNTSYIKSSNWLDGCVPDAKNVYTNITLRGEWTTANATLFTDSQGTFAAVSNKLMSFASSAVSGDVVLYYHSSHGYQDSGTDTGICMYDRDMPDSSFAQILANFKAGVKVVIVLDTCHSAGMFKSLRRDGTTRDLNTGSPFTFVERVNEELAAIRADEAARGIRTAPKLAVLDCGWITAADYYQYSWDGNDGGKFTTCFVGSVKSGACDKSPYGNGDSYATFKEMFDYAVAQDITHGDGNPSSEDYTMPQCTNTAVLAAVTFGWVGKEAPGGVRFAPIPAQTATVGQPLNYTVVASNAVGYTGDITYSVASSTAPSGSYSLNATSGAFTFTPATDGTFTFNFVGTNTTAHTGGKATMTVTADLAAPSSLENSGISDTSFTANWAAVPGAASYFLEVFAVDPGTSAAAKAASDAFELVTSADNLTAGEYLILAATNNRAMNNICSGDSGGYFSYETVTIDGTSISTDDASIIWTLEGDASSCTLFNAAAGKYANPAKSKTTGWAAEASGAWELELASGLVTAANAADTSWSLQYNASSPRFTCYDSKQQKLRFFRRDGASGALFSGDVGNVTSYTVTDLIPGDYQWRVRAIGNAKGPFSELQDVTLLADPTAPPSIRPIADIDVTVGQPATATVAVSAPEEFPVTSIEITEGDPSATLQDGVFSFTPIYPNTYDFTITAVNANGSTPVSFTVTATLAEPETPETPTDVDSDSFTAVWDAIPGAESYELDVVQGATSGGGGGGGGGTVALSEDFSSVVSNSAAITDFANYTKNAGWSGENAYPSDGMLKFGASKKAGTFLSPAVAVAGNVTVTWTGKSWSKDNTVVNVGVSEDGGKTFTETAVQLKESLDEYSTSHTVSASSVVVRWQSSAASNQRFFISKLEVSSDAKARELSGTHVEGYPKNVGNVTSYDVTGLQPNTEYTFAFRAIAGEEASEWSEPVSVTTADGPAAPSWTAIPAQSAAVGYPFSIDLSAYVSGVPTPALALAAGTAELAGTVLSFTPYAVGEYTFTITASNSSGDPADATLTVNAIEHVPTKYAVCVGINKYDASAYYDLGWEVDDLSGCVNDSKYFRNNLVERGGWNEADATLLNDSKATTIAIRQAVSNVAAIATAGDTFVYQHSSHGLNLGEDDYGLDVALGTYNDFYYDYEMAADLASFPAGVKVVVVVDACHSGGLFKSKEAAKAAAAAFDLAGRVTAIMDADRAARKARGENVAKTLSSSEIGWVTAAEYNETSIDYGFYDTDTWLTDPDAEGNTVGGSFLASSTWGWWNGTADADAEAGDNDGFCDPYEFWKQGYDFCTKLDEFWGEDGYTFTPQCTNVAVLKSVELGWVKDPRPAAPANPKATGVTASSFTASWDASEGAASYSLFVQKKLEAPKADSATLLEESFEGTELPEGWTMSGTGTKIYSGKAYDGSQCVVFTAKDAYLITPALENPNAVSVWFMKTKNAAQWSLDVSVSDSVDGPWTSLGTIDNATTNWQEFTANITTDASYVKFTDTRPSGNAERYIDFVTITGTPGAWEDVEGYAPASVTGPSKEVTGLEMGTEYRFTVTAIDAEGVESLPSERVNVTTAEEDTKPVWSEIPEQSAVAGQVFTFKPADYVKASPAATITVTGSSLADGEYQFADGILSFTPAAEGTYTFDFQAANTLGVAEATLTVVAAGAPVYVPTLALSNPGSEGFDASWTACTGATSYQLQVATDDQFTTGGGGEGGAFTLVTSAAGFTAGEYVILADGTDCAMNNTYAGTSSKYLSCTDVTVTGNTVSTEEPAIIWTLAGDASSCTLFNSDAGKYVNPAATKTVGWADTASGSWTLSVTEDGIVTAANADDTSWVLQYNSNNPRFMCYSSSQKKLRFFRRDAAKSAAKDDGSLVLDTTTPDLAYTVTGLEPETTYFARVRMAEGDWSAIESIKTQSDVPTPPAWLDLPAQTATVGLEFGLDLSSYVTGSPFPTITVDGTVAEGGSWSFTPDEAKTYTFELIATNTQGSDSTTLTVVASPAPAAKYALCVGLNEYDYAAWAAQGWGIDKLKGCVNDATYLKKNLTERGGWADADVTLLTNETATKEALRATIADAAAKAKAGDTFVYQHSSHGLNHDDPYGKNVGLATYAAIYDDFELAEDLAAFADGVKVVIAIDACHSAGMFKKGAAATAGSFDIAARVSALMDADRTARKARGEDVSRNLSSDQVGWITAANYDEESKDGGYYDTDEWMSDEDAEGDVPGGTFLASLTWGWWSGKADVSGTGDGDGWFDAYEGWGFASPVCIEEGFTPQFLNEDVLRSVELGYAGETAPSEAILFDPVPGATVGIGEEARLTVVAKNPDGTTEGITLSVVDAPEGADYAFSSETGTLTFTPDEDGLFLFTVQAVNGRTSATKLLGVTAVLPAPVALDATDTDDDSFTANWTGVDAARGYELQVSTDPNFPEDEPDTVVKEGFDNVTTDVSSLPEGWEFSGEFKIYTTTASSGEAPPSIQLKPNDATLTTPEFKLRRMGGLSFWTKGNGSGTNMTSVLKVEQLVGEDWQELDSFTPTTASAGETKRYENVDLDATRFRFVMSKPDGAVGNIAIDDVMVITLPADAAMVLEDEIPAGTTSCAVEDLTPGTTYYYRVRAIANTASAWSETIEVTTMGEAPVPVPELTALIPETMPDSALFAFWTCEGVSEYRMQVATDEGFASLVYDEVLAEDTKTVTGLSPETTYYVRVCGLDGERVGDWSNVERVTTAAVGPVGEEVRITSMSITGGTMSLGFEGPGAAVYAASDPSAVGYAEWTLVPEPDAVVSGTNATITLPADMPVNNYRIAR